MTVETPAPQEVGAQALTQEEVDAVHAVHNSEQEGDGHDDHGHNDHHHHHSDEFHWYSRPRQRQKWGESQVLPHTNFNDLFFDLFYVAAAYNLGSLIRASPTSLGLLYFAGCFYPIMMIWFQKTFYDSRFDSGNDLYHKVYEFLLLVVLATAVLYIRPVSYLSTPSSNEDMFVFATCIATGSLMAIGRSIDVILNVDGEPAAKSQGWFEMKMFGFMTAFYVAAAILSGLDHFGSSSSTSESYYGSNSYDTNSTGAYDTTNSTTAANESHRFLAGSGDYGDTNHVPIILLFCGSLTYTLSIALLVFRMEWDKNFNPKENAVPMNIGFFIHRFGEWIMLMLGESVLSLLIVPTQQGDYYKAFFCGILSITVLQVLHFRSQPHDADGHALRRSRKGGVIFIAFGQLYSAALIVLGTSYKMILFEFVFAQDAGEAHRLLRDAGYSPEEIAQDAELQRYLAASGPPIEDAEVRQQHVAHYFCISMAIVWLCLDVMLVAHKGITFNMMRCSDSHCSKSTKKLAVGMVFIRAFLIVGFATMGFYVTEPSLLSFLGLLGIIVQVGLRLGGSKAFDANPFESSRVPQCSNNFNGPKTLSAVSLRLQQITGKKLISCEGKKTPA